MFSSSAVFIEFFLQADHTSFRHSARLYEVRERPTNTYSWQSFIISNIVAEIPWTSVSAFVFYVCWYYPVGLWQNAESADAVHERGAMMFLLIPVFLTETSTFAHTTMTGIDEAETAESISNTVHILFLTFCGVLAAPDTTPHFYIFMYRILDTAVARASIICGADECLLFPPPANQTSSTYLSELISTNDGYHLDASSSTQYSCCPLDNMHWFLKSVSTSSDNSWRDFGMMCVFITVTCVGSIGIYWLATVPRFIRGEKQQKRQGQRHDPFGDSS
ncbi:ABC-2 type transporter-domain-containing protein [Amylocarpus encephaloides]|uniref:ABC-2 type transporter-domain-containing protein n=1 Tax=Amylocarpus encephaloides TaxID=45428 RepID=A0A9P8CAH4_9HELO|nr:ABC-2 type transporter-domain-containing protein [Amylocarpus encephaloides]